MAWSSSVTKRTDSFFSTGSAVGASDEELERIRAEQRARAEQLRQIVSQAQPLINDINKINEQIEQAKACEAAASGIPGMVSGACSMMSQVGSYLQSGLVINGTPVGVNVASDGSAIQANIESQVNAIKGAVQAYCGTKNAEGMAKYNQAKQLEAQYNSIKAQGIGGFSAPAFPAIPEVKSY